jgi:3-deoxy-manno-octulosonate cytidylyltransferase (CMP-KDO synthetase)
MKTVAVIPARFASGRFPGKPLANICGKPMVWYAWNAACRAENIDSVYVATDDERIADVCYEFGAEVVMTSTAHPCATDRLAEVSEKISADLYVNVLGDEPLVVPADISLAVKAFSDKQDTSDIYAVYLCEKYRYPVDAVNPTTIKYALNDRNEIIYMSRSVIPFPHSRIDYDLYKHVGVYVYAKKALDFFKDTSQGKLESIESIEQLRLLENRKLIKAAVTDNFSMSVDTPKDLERIRKIVNHQASITPPTKQCT